MKVVITLILPSLFIFLILSCSEQGLRAGNETKEVRLGLLKLQIPITDTFINAPGIDSYVAYIVNEKKDTFHIEYGKKNIIYTLFDFSPKALPLKEKEILQRQFGKTPNPNEVIFTDSPDIDNIQNVFDKNFYLLDTVNYLPVKIVQPKKIGNGMTGILISDLKDGNSLSIYAKNLDSNLHRKALTMFNTISYK